MSTTRSRVHRVGAAALAAAIAFLASSQAAWSIYEEPEEPDTGPVPEYVARPDLFVYNANITKSSTGWQLVYTVKNNGDAPSGSFRLAFAKDGTTQVGTKAEASIDAKGVRTSSVNLSRSTCYIALKLTVDDQKVVTEASEGNNVKWLVGQAEDVCADAPKYRVQALRLKAVEQSHGDSGSSDEPYLTISRVINAGT
jgi:cyclic lactone autoinducer peptide